MISVVATEKNPIELVLKAFSKSVVTQSTIAFHGLSSIPEYVPVVVEIKSKIGNIIKYVAVDAGEHSPVLSEHELDLTRLDDVWPRLPSTLDGWDAVEKPYALLFLSESYLKGGITHANGRTERQDVFEARPKVDGPCTKWPCATGDIREIKKKVEALRADNEKLLADNARLQRDYADVTNAYADLRAVHGKVTDIYALLKQHVTELQPMLTPDQLTKIDLAQFP